MMRKALSVILLLSVLFCLSACGLPTEESTETKDALIANPLVKDRLNRIPVASGEMSVQQLRRICVDFMRLQLSFPWTPNTAFTYQNKNKSITIPVDKVIGGMPYISQSKGSIYNFLHFYDEEDGTFDAAFAMSLKQPYMKVIANQCSGSAYWAWARVSNRVRYMRTSDMLGVNGCIPVGDYYIDPKIQNFNTENVATKDICEANGRQVMFASYAKLQMADGVVHFNSGGHVMMVALDPTVVFNGDGTIDGEKSYLTLLEQTSAFTEDTQHNGKPISIQGGIHFTYTFEKLFTSGYLPFTIPEFLGIDPVEKAEVSTNLPQNGVFMSTLSTLKVQSNYPISYVTVTVKDRSGTAIYSCPVYTMDLNIYEFMPISAEYLNLEELSVFANGLHTVEISAMVGTGETLTAYRGVFKQ